MVASACLTLAAMQFLVWFKKRTAWGNLLFSTMAVATAAGAFSELWMMRAETPGQFATALRWHHVPVWLGIVSIVGFVQLHLRAGRPWLAWSACVLRTISLLLNFLMEQNLNYREIIGLRQVPFLGESVSVAEGVTNPWMLVGQMSLLLFLVFVTDATITVWRRGDRRRALVIGGGIVIFVLAATVQAVLVRWEIVRGPITISFFFMLVVAAVAYEMSHDVVRAAQLSDDLRESEEALRYSQADLRTLAGRLISAQEEALRRLSRELHDDLTQRLAVLAIEAGSLELQMKNEHGSLSAYAQKIALIKAQLIKVSEDVHHLSRQLHPSILDDLGLVRAIEAGCAEFMREQNIEITFSKEDVPDMISGDISLCLYRVVQEGLRNIATHSRANSCEIFLKGAGDTICLTVKDDGIGFDPLGVRQKPGLGLASMRERVQLIRGNFSIKSQPGKGTELNVCTPLTGGDF